MIEYTYRKAVPRFIKEKISILFNPSYTLSINPGDRVQNYFNACKKELKLQNNFDFNNVHLHKAFKENKVRSNLIENQWWSDFILLLSLTDSPKFHKINQSLINRIKTSNFNSLEYFEVLHIYSLSLRFGLFELGYHLRQQSIKIALSYSTSLKKNKSWKIKAKLSALLETDNFSEFDKLFPEFEKVIPLFKTRWKKEKYLLIYLREILGDQKNSFDKSLVSRMDKNNDNKFRKFLENKKIFIVGPTPNLKPHGNLIDGSDIIIRTNYKDKDSLKDFEFLGSRCDITYINAAVTRDIIKNPTLNWPKDISWVVGKIRSHAREVLKKLSSDKIDTNHINGRDLQQVEPALFNGFLNALPNILIDLSRYNPKEIFLCNFDLMLSKDRFPGYYSEHLKTNIKIEGIENIRLRGFGVHDPVTQFNIIKTFWKRGFIKGDNRFEQVINMEVLDYMKNLQKNYL